MSVTKLDEKLYKVRWREGGRARSVTVHGPEKLAKTIERKKLTLRAENRHLDVKKQINYRMDDLIDKYWTQYGVKKKSADREKSIVEGIRSLIHDIVAELPILFVKVQVPGRLNDLSRYFCLARQELECCRTLALHWYESGLVE